MFPADAGSPMSDNLVARAVVQKHEFPAVTRQVSLRNAGKNTLWVSLNKRNWIDIAAGTSWDDRASVEALWYCTQLGTTTAVVVGLALISRDEDDDDADDDGDVEGGGD
jgi:hypothetical protein